MEEIGDTIPENQPWQNWRDLFVDLLLFNILKKSLIPVIKNFFDRQSFSFFFFFIFIAHFRLPPTFVVNPLFISCHNCL